MTTAPVGPRIGPRIGIVGAGAWGTALALVARRAGREVLIWGHGSDVVAAINQRHENPLLLPGIALDRAIRATGDMAELASCDTVLLVPPAQHLREVATLLAPHLASGAPVALCAKGVELESLKLMTEVAAEILPGRPIAVISGPTLAPEVARDLPTAVTVAAADEGVGRAVVEATIKVHVGGERLISTAEGNGPVNALDTALRQVIVAKYPHLADIELVNYKVRILDENHGTGAVTRVLLDASDGETTWGSIGVSENIIEASWEALVDSIEYGMLRSQERG